MTGECTERLRAAMNTEKQWQAGMDRYRELVDVYTAALGGPSALTEDQQSDIRNAAELVAYCETARACAVQEGIADACEAIMARGEFDASRAVARLNLPPGTPASIH